MNTENHVVSKDEAPYQLARLTDFVRRGRNSYQKGMSFKKWSDKMILVHDKAVVPYLAPAWKHVTQETLPTMEDIMTIDSINKKTIKFSLLSRKIIVAIAAGAFVLSGLFPPWLHTFDVTATPTRTDAGFAFIFSPPQPKDSNRHGIQLDTSRLLIEWSCILMTAGAAWFLCGTSKPRQDSSDA